jgi:ABC-type Mn2+/Zn2+ transport system permease subunit
MTVLAVALGVGSGIVGLLISRAVDVAAGGTVVLVLAVAFLSSALLSGLLTGLWRRSGDGVRRQVPGESLQTS